MSLIPCFNLCFSPDRDLSLKTHDIIFLMMIVLSRMKGGRLNIKDFTQADHSVMNSFLHPLTRIATFKTCTGIMDLEIAHNFMITPLGGKANYRVLRQIVYNGYRDSSKNRSVGRKRWEPVLMFTLTFLRFLNWKASLSRNKPARIIESLHLHEGQVIADIGSGGGYFTLEFAKRVGKTGRVYAVDIEQDYLDFISRRSKKERLSNILLVHVKGDELKLPEADLDLAFARDVFHHLPEPEKYFRTLRKFLKPTGKVAIIELKRTSRFSFVSIFKHYTPPETIGREMKKVGYSLNSSFDFLPERSFSLFEAKN